MNSKTEANEKENKFNLLYIENKPKFEIQISHSEMQSF